MRRRSPLPLTLWFATVLAALALGAGAISHAQAPPPSVAVIDGDTFEADGVRYRLDGVDAPSLSGRCPAERALARLARDRLASLLAHGALTFEVTGRQPATARYSERVVARVQAGGVDVGQALIAAGVARPEAAPGAWCETIRDTPRG